MNFKEFENTYRLIGYYQHEKNKVIKELLSLDDLEHLYNSFAKELNLNLLGKGSKSNKNNVIRYYLTQLRQLQYIFKERKIKNKEESTEFDLYKELAHVIYIELFNDIQLACNTNKIKFFKLCDEIKINTSTFDNAITLVYSENKNEPQPIKTRTDYFKEYLENGGFYNLEKTKRLSVEGKNRIIKLLSNNKMPYGIAMFDYLGFCIFLDTENGVKYKTNKYLSRLYNENAKDGTQAKHNRNSLLNNNSRYTSYLHTETVIKDYEELK